MSDENVMKQTNINKCNFYRLILHQTESLVSTEMCTKCVITCRCLYHAELLISYTVIICHAPRRVIVYGKPNLVITLVTTSITTWPIMWSESNRGRLWKLSTYFQPIRSRDICWRYDKYIYIYIYIYIYMYIYIYIYIYIYTYTHNT